MDFERAEYVKPEAIEGTVISSTGSQHNPARDLPLALIFGCIGAAIGAVGYALIGLTGFMVSIVTIGIGWIVARAMMTATRGIGGSLYQVVAVLLTYLSASCGRLMDVLYNARRQGYDLSQISSFSVMKLAILGPFLRFSDNPFWAAMGLLILFYGLRTAWQLAAGSPGFGQAGGVRMSIMGLRR